MQVFLSYASEAESLAEQLEKDMRAEGINLWRYRSEMRVGEDWENRIRDVIRASHCIIYLGTRTAHASRVIRAELGIANMYKKTIYPIFAEGDSWAEIAPLEIFSYHYIDIRDNRYSVEIKRLIKQIKSQNQHNFLPPLRMEEGYVNSDDLPQREARKGIMSTIWTSMRALLASLRRQKIAPKPTPPEEGTSGESSHGLRNPYKGLRAFTIEDAQDFFGREKVIERMIKELKHIIDLEKYHDKMREPRFMTVVGPSGSGKSSVVMAGLLSRLQKGEGIPDSSRWTLLPVVCPGEKPLNELARALGQKLSGHISQEEIRDKLRDPSICALNLYAEQIAGQGNRVVLIVDQFEELFTLTTSDEEREQFVHQLVTAATEPENKVIIVATLRIDFYDYPMQYPSLYSMIEAHRIAIPPMTIDDLHAAIEKPAKLPGIELRFEENLIGDLLFELRGQEENLPLLQFTLEELFGRRAGNCLTRQAYEEIGGVKGALNRHAQKIYDDLPTDEHRQRAEALFIRLINPGKLDQDATRRRVPASEFDVAQDPLMQETIDTFIKARLITANRVETSSRLGESESTPVYEISHEALISAWEQLTKWIETARDDMILRETLNHDIEKWERQGHKEALLYSNYRLKDSEEWMKRNISSERERAFLFESRRHEQHTRFKHRISFVMIILLIISVAAFPVWIISMFITIPTTVTTLQDGEPRSLRWEIQHVPPGSLITFDPSLQGGTITLTKGDLVINDSLTIEGPRNQQIIITNQITDTRTSGYKIRINPDETHIISVTFINLVFANSTESGSAVTGGAFIENHALSSLTLKHCVVKNNRSAYYNGGGIANLHGDLAIEDNSVIASNQAKGGNGGGIYSWDGNLTISNSSVTKNSATEEGGGIFAVGGSLILNGVVISNNQTTDNSSTSNGGGISMLDGTLIISPNVVTGNSTIINENATKIFNNSTKGYGGGLTLLGTGALIAQTIITRNTAGGKGGGLAVERDFESGADSSITIKRDSNSVSASTSALTIALTSAGIMDNQAPDRHTTDILGIPHANGGYVTVNDDASEPTGSPAPSYPPEKSSHFLGTIALDAFCQKSARLEKGVSLKLVNNDTEHIQCLIPNGTAYRPGPFIDFQKACQSQYPTFMNGVARLADYYDPSSWQCYTHEQLLGPITPYLDSYCKYEGYAGSNTAQSAGTAYGWYCIGSGNRQISIAITNVCQWHYSSHAKDAFDVLTDFNRPDGWACWAPE